MGSSNADPTVVGRVIGDVVDIFVPTANMAVFFGNHQVTNGSGVKPSIAVSAPRVPISGNPTDLYTLVMSDPDAPSPSEPGQREWVQWIVTDIPGGTSASDGKEILAYSGPRPKVGIHRYIMVLFEQKEALGFIAPPESRAHFFTRGFAHHFNLLPASVVYFNSQREPPQRKR